MREVPSPKTAWMMLVSKAAAFEPNVTGRGSNTISREPRNSASSAPYRGHHTHFVDSSCDASEGVTGPTDDSNLIKSLSSIAI